MLHSRGRPVVRVVEPQAAGTGGGSGLAAAQCIPSLILPSPEFGDFALDAALSQCEGEDAGRELSIRRIVPQSGVLSGGA